MNRELLAQVRDQILAETDKFNMGWWTREAQTPEGVQQGKGQLDEDGGSCGTTACLAGWAMTLDALNNGYTWQVGICSIHLNGKTGYFGDAAVQVLDLPVRVQPRGEGVGTCDLFLVEQWPQRYQKMLEVEGVYDLNEAPAALQAKAAAELISDLLDGFAYFDDDGKLCDLRAEMDEIVEEQVDA